MSLKDRPTPETDAHVKSQASGSAWDQFIHADFSRDMERQRDYAIAHGNRCVSELNAEIDRLNERNKQTLLVCEINANEVARLTAEIDRIKKGNERKLEVIMDRLEGRILCYQREAKRLRIRSKQYTLYQMESAKAKAMQEARLIVWMNQDEDDNQ